MQESYWFFHTLTETSTTQVTLFCTLQCSGVEFYGQCVLRVKLFPSAADSNSRKKSDYMLYNFFISSMKTHENLLSEDLHGKTSDNFYFLTPLVTNWIKWGVTNRDVLLLATIFQYLGIFINQMKKGHICYRVYLNLKPVIKNGSKLLPTCLIKSLKTDI